MKKLIFLYLLSLALVNGFSAQQTEAPDSLLDTVHFDDIQIYNKITQKTFGLYTKRESIINFAEEEGRTFFIETSKVPFFRFPTSLAEYPNPAREFIAYIVFSDISKEKLLSEYILINHVRPNDNIILIIKHGSDIIILDKNTKPSDLASFFQKSYAFGNISI
jgi:hypothetical protein